MDDSSILGQMAAEVAHTINNPLGYLCANLDIIRQHTAEFRKHLELAPARDHIDDIKIRSALEEIPAILDESAEGLQHVAQFVTKLSVLTLLTQVHERHWVDINSMICDISEELSIRFGTVRFTIYNSTIPSLRCSPAFRAALFAITENGAEASGVNGSVMIATGIDDDAIVIRVRDTGPGIAPEIVNRLFEPFISTKPGCGARGIGLTLAHSAILQHGGTLSLRSEANGTEAMLRLPISTEVTDAPAAARDNSPNTFTKGCFGYG